MKNLSIEFSIFSIIDGGILQSLDDSTLLQEAEYNEGLVISLSLEIQTFLESIPSLKRFSIYILFCDLILGKSCILFQFNQRA